MIQHKSLSEFIVQDLEQKIIDGTLEPGQRIYEGDLCKAYGVSQTPLREAFRTLESRGFVTREPRKGISVPKITRKEVEDIYRLRAAIEGLALYLAVKKQDPKLLAKLKKMHGQMCAVAREKKIDAYIRLNQKFHATMIQASENSRLIQLIDNFEKQTLRYRRVAYASPGWLEDSIAAHAAYVKLFESGDAEKAEKKRKKMIMDQVERFARIFAPGQEAPNAQ